MATKAVFCALGVLAVLSTSAVRADLVSLSESDLTVFAALTSDPQCNEQEQSCAGCTTRVICAKLGKAWVNLENATCSGTTPYCLNGTCQASMPNSSCSETKPVDSFPCPDDGYWPDLLSCTNYFFCTNSSAYRLDCSAYPNTVYDQASSMCVPRTQSACYTLVCPAAGAFQIYKPDPRIYAACRSTNPADAVLATCDDGEAFDLTAKDCVPTCLRAGRFAIGTDAKKFNECVDLGGGRLSKPTLGECPGISTFHKSTQRCAAP